MTLIAALNPITGHRKPNAVNFSLMANDRNTKLVIVFVALLLMLNYPIIGIFDKQELWMGFLVLYFYLFFLWLLTIVAVGLIVKNKQKSN